MNMDKFHDFVIAFCFISVGFLFLAIALKILMC